MQRTYRLWHYITIPLKHSTLPTLLVMLERVTQALIPSFQVVLTARFVDTAIGIFNGKSDYDMIFPPLLLILASIACQYLLGSLAAIFKQLVNASLTTHFRTSMLEKRSALEYRHIENNDSWDLISRTCKDPVDKVMNGLDQIMGAMDLIVRVTSLLVILVASVWWAAILIMVVSVPLFLVSLKAGKTNYEAFQEAEKHKRRADYIGKVLSDREYVEERSLFGYTEHVSKQWLEKFEIARKIKLKAMLNNFIRMKGSSLITILMSVVIAGVLIPPLGSGHITIGLFMGLITATINLIQLMSWQLAWVTSELAKSREYLKDLTKLSELSEQPDATVPPVDMSNFALGDIEFRQVSFKYPDTERYILQNCSFTLKAGQHYAFVGVNGAGKTTITKLLTGMYDNYEGDILINGKNLRTYKLPELKGLFAVVYQDFARYYVTLKDNILLGDVATLQPDAQNTADIQNRLKYAMDTIEVTEVTDKLANGIDTILGKIKEGGVDLSGGEWQRVAIARALFGKARMYILDEPTAALDPVAESRVYEMFGKISAGKSTVFITHRLGAARLADEILVIDGGKIAESGNHDTLMQLRGIYAGMFESQKGWYE